MRLLAGAVLLWGLALPLDLAAITRNFSIKAGPAETQLNEFAVQSGLQVLFETELAQNRRVNAVRGDYTMGEALDRLLGDTGLAAQYDEKSGIVTIARAESKKPVVRLPPYTVEGEPISWRYARAGNIEVLSSCTDDVTNRVIQQIHRLHEALEQIVPPEFIFQSDQPIVYVLHSDRDHASLPPELMEKLRQQEKKESAANTLIWNIGIMRSYIFWDVDSRAIYFILNEGAFMVGRLSIRGDYLHQMMERRSPSLPAWYIQGMVELYSTITLDPYGARAFAMEIKNRHRIPGGVAKFKPFVWLSEEETQSMRKGHEPGLVPLADLITGSAPTAADLSRRNWRAQGALFVRWALDDVKNGREALWDLLRRSDDHALTETDFKECFGLSFAEADEKLRRYLPKAVKREFELKPDKFDELPAYVLRSATDLDTAWTKGDLDRLKINYVRRYFPELTDRYIEQARRILKQGYGMGGDHDARLLGLLGLCECDVGDDVAAQPLLEAAVNGGAERPRVYYELARIRFEAAMQATKGGHITEAEADSVLRLLVMACAHHPPLPSVYELMAETCAAVGVNRQELILLREGLKQFPRRTGLIKSVARVHAQLGLRAEAQAVLQRGIAMAEDPAARQELTKLQLKLAGQ